MEKKGKIRNNMYLQLFWTFFKLGLFTIGGGMAMIPLIQGIVVDQKKWMTEEEAVDCIAVSQGLPGVIAINMKKRWHCHPMKNLPSVNCLSSQH